jgi:hypothetical protein
MIVEDGKEFDKVTSEFPHDLVPLITSVKETKAFKASPKLLSDLDDLDKDLRYFTSNKDNKLRRDIDLQKVYPFPSRYLSP